MAARSSNMVRPHHTEYTTENIFRAVRPSVAGAEAIKSLPRASIPGFQMDPMLLAMGQEFDGRAAEQEQQQQQQPSHRTLLRSATIAEDDDAEILYAEMEAAAQEAEERLAAENEAQHVIDELEKKKAEKLLLQQQLAELTKETGGIAGMVAASLKAKSSSQEEEEEEEEEENEEKDFKEPTYRRQGARIMENEADDDNSQGAETEDEEEDEEERRRPGQREEKDEDEDEAPVPTFAAASAEDIFSVEMVEETWRKMKIVREHCLAITAPTETGQQRAETNMRTLLAVDQEARLQEDEVRVRRYLRWEEDRTQNVAQDNAKSGVRKARRALGRLKMIEKLAKESGRDWKDPVPMAAEKTPRSAAGKHFRKGVHVVQATTTMRRNSSSKKDKNTSTLPALVTK